ncbi:hypothetical protein J25TS5_49080 [Paenibacillus faecis]|uniref:hypothetical protein n=1 Tax=Paenibacillus faecis TaxID=862114 RepID=UPI001B2C173F|nr:hypothetical protein [Paenibacillus faecis]GIO87976.1 hypothetical protein J25TS5_49080 [Paenibacillus faecis]
MAQKEVFDLNFEVDSRELDQADKKLRSLDKLLAQTERRASLLGKAKIAPKITLEDRFSAAADKVERRLSKLQRTTVRPIVGLADGVTAAAARIRASLLGLTGTPWRVRVEGVDWDGVIGGTFSNWMGSKGKETLQQISSSIGSSLGGGLKDMDGKRLDKVPEKVTPIRSLEVDRKLLEEEKRARITEGGGTVDYLSKREDLIELLGKSQKQRFTPYNNSPSTTDRIGSALKWVGDFANEVGKEMKKQLFTEPMDKLIDLIGPKLIEKWKTGLKDIKFQPNKFSKNLEPAKNWVTQKAWPFIKKSGTTLSSKLNLSKTGLILDLFDIFTAKPGRDRAQKIGGAVGGIIGGAAGAIVGSALPALGNVLLGATLSAGGSQLGELAGGGIFDLFYGGETSQKELSPLWREPFIKYPEVFKPHKDYLSSFERFENFKREASNFSLGVNGSHSKSDSNKNVSINVSFSDGAVQVTHHKEELNIAELSNITAQRVANEIRLAMQNVG